MLVKLVLLISLELCQVILSDFFSSFAKDYLCLNSYNLLSENIYCDTLHEQAQIKLIYIVLQYCTHFYALVKVSYFLPYKYW